MIRSGSFPGVAFGTAADGDGRVDTELRIGVADEVGAPRDWAIVSQVHGSNVVVAETGGHLGEADGLITETTGVSLVVATADCLPVAVAGRQSMALVHAGWRGIVSGVIPAAMEAMRAMGDEPSEAAIGPHIGPCCYEVGTEVIRALGGHASTTSWGTQSADLASAARLQLGGLPVWASPSCTMDDVRFNSFRRDGTARRQVTVAWLPKG